MAKAPTTRRAVRETALRVLYTLDAGKQPVDEFEAILADAAEAAELDDKARTLLQTLVDGTVKNRGEIDATLDRLATGFPTDRQAVVDRNILRMACAEIVYRITEAPPGAVVNEAVELAKKYSTKESGRFVNGVLGALVREIETGEPSQETIPPPAPGVTALPDNVTETLEISEDEDADA